MELGKSSLTNVIYGMAQIIDECAFNLPEGVAEGPGYVTRREAAIKRAIQIMAFLIGHGLDIRSWMDHASSTKGSTGSDEGVVR